MWSNLDRVCCGRTVIMSHSDYKDGVIGLG